MHRTTCRAITGNRGCNGLSHCGFAPFSFPNIRLADSGEVNSRYASLESSGDTSNQILGLVAIPKPALSLMPMKIDSSRVGLAVLGMPYTSTCGRPH